MPTLEQDLAFVRLGLEELEAYLLADELYWPLSGPVALPRFTLGGLLLSLRRVCGWAPSEAGHFQSVLEPVRLKWRSAWERKARREVHARIDLWKNYLADYRQAPETQVDFYPQQVQWRVVLQLLSGELTESPQELTVLADLDKVLKSFWLPGAFVWDASLQIAFPQEEFWFLYGKLK